MDTFSGWVDALPSRTKIAAQVAKVLQIETIPRLGLPGSLQSNNSAFLPPASSDERDKKCPGHKGLALSLETPIVEESREIESDLERNFSQTMPGDSRKSNCYFQLSCCAYKLKLSDFELMYGRPLPQEVSPSSP